MIKIFEETTKQPITLIGKMAGICYGANTENDEKNYKRGLDCIKSNHGRTLEFPEVYMEISDYSIKVMREFYTHIGGSPTRLQESTRYVKFDDLTFVDVTNVVPKKLQKDHLARQYLSLLDKIADLYADMLEEGIPQEDASYILPLATTTKVVVRMNLRTLIEMSHQRLCSRAFHEYRDLMRELLKELADYSDEWKWIVENCMKPKCEVTGFCIESRSCGRKPKRDE